MESDVYALDDHRIVRVLKKLDYEELKDRADLSALLVSLQLPWAVPQVLEYGNVDGTPFSIESRVVGTVMRKVFPTLSQDDRRKVLHNFLLATEPLSSIPVSNRPFGEIIGKQKVQADSWPDFLNRKVSAALSKSLPTLREDVPGFDAVHEQFNERLAELHGFTGTALVHGDFYPANLMLAPDLTVSGVLDFSNLTIVGDPDIDRAETLSTVEDPSRDGVTREEAEYYRELLTERYGPAIIEKLRLYQLYYALLFSDCWEADQVTYEWCLKILRSVSSGEHFALHGNFRHNDKKQGSYGNP